MDKVIAIIPARGGSKRIPDKNVRDFCGKPMIAYTIEIAIGAGIFDTIHVSTESSRIAKMVENFGLSVDFLRPARLADDNTPIMPVLKYVTEYYQAGGKTFDAICLLAACAPLIEVADLIAAEETFRRSEGTRPLLAVTKYPVPVEWAFERNKDGTLYPNNPGAFAIRSQDLGVKYYDAGVFAFFPVNRVLNSVGPGSDDGFLGYVLPHQKVLDIDEPEDWLLAEFLYRVKEEIKRTGNSRT
jgi:N-acylneuraminate cytidylyltransferase